MFSYVINCCSETALTLHKAIHISRADEATNIHEQEFAKDKKERSTTGRTHTSGTHAGNSAQSQAQQI